MIVGGGSATTIIDGGGLDRILHHTVFPGALPSPEVIVSGVTLRNGGGELSLGGAVYNVGRMRLTDVTVEESAAAFFGGGIQNDGVLHMEMGTIGPGNGAAYGAGIFNFGELTLTDSTINGNDAGNQGGGLYNFGTATISGSTLSRNSAANEGGGIVNDGGTMEIVNSTISGNEATRGGGIANGAVTPGFRVRSPIGHLIPASLNALNVTVAANSADVGGNLLHVEGSTATLKNTLIGEAESGGDCAGAPITSTGHNLDSDGTCGFEAPGDIGGGYPGLIGLFDNGGPTLTYEI